MTGGAGCGTGVAVAFGVGLALGVDAACCGFCCAVSGAWTPLARPMAAVEMAMPPVVTSIALRTVGGSFIVLYPMPQAGQGSLLRRTGSGTGVAVALALALGVTFGLGVDAIGSGFW